MAEAPHSLWAEQAWIDGRWQAAGSGETDPVKVEHDLNPMVPAAERGVFSLRVILHGRRVCFARKPA